MIRYGIKLQPLESSPRASPDSDGGPPTRTPAQMTRMPTRMAGPEGAAPPSPAVGPAAFQVMLHKYYY